MQAHVGRLLGPDDDRPESQPAAVIAHAWWVSAFGASEDVLGQTLILNFQSGTEAETPVTGIDNRAVVQGGMGPGRTTVVL